MELNKLKIKGWAILNGFLFSLSKFFTYKVVLMAL